MPHGFGHMNFFDALHLADSYSWLWKSGVPSHIAYRHGRVMVIGLRGKWMVVKVSHYPAGATDMWPMAVGKQQYYV